MHAVGDCLSQRPISVLVRFIKPQTDEMSALEHALQAILLFLGLCGGMNFISFGCLHVVSIGSFVSGGISMNCVLAAAGDADAHGLR